MSDFIFRASIMLKRFSAGMTEETNSKKGSKCFFLLCPVLLIRPSACTIILMSSCGCRMIITLCFNWSSGTFLEGLAWPLAPVIPVWFIKRQSVSLSLKRWYASETLATFFLSMMPVKLLPSVSMWSCTLRPVNSSMLKPAAAIFSRTMSIGEMQMPIDTFLIFSMMFA